MNVSVCFRNGKRQNFQKPERLLYDKQRDAYIIQDSNMRCVIPMSAIDMLVEMKDEKEGDI